MKRFLMIISLFFISTYLFSQNYYTDTLKFETKNVKCIYTYPVLNGERYSNINKHLKETIYEMFEDDCKNLYKASDEDVTFSNTIFFSELSCSIFTINDSFLSIRFYNESFSGGAHPSHHFFSYNYNFKLKKEFEFKDYKISKNGLKKISDYCVKEVKRQLKEKGEQNRDLEISPDVETFKVFNIDDKGIYFTFNEYEILPYYLGSFTVFMPKKEFKKILTKK